MKKKDDQKEKQEGIPIESKDARDSVILSSTSGVIFSSNQLVKELKKASKKKGLIFSATDDDNI